MTKRTLILLGVLFAVTLGSAWLDRAAATPTVPALPLNGVNLTRTGVDLCPASNATCIRSRADGDPAIKIGTITYSMVRVSPEPSPALDGQCVVYSSSYGGFTNGSCGGGGGGTVTSITIGNGLSSTQSPLTTSGTMSIDTSVTVDKTTSQTLTNKTLTSPAVSSPALSGTATGTYTLGGTPTVTGYGYIGECDLAPLGAASTSSTTFVDIGNGSSTGFAGCTISAPVAKTYLLEIKLVHFMSVLAGNQQTLYQVTVDGSAPGGQPTNVMIFAFAASGTYYPNSFTVPLSLSAGSHTFKLQWKVDNGSSVANITSNANSHLQYVLTGG